MFLSIVPRDSRVTGLSATVKLQIVFCSTCKLNLSTHVLVQSLLFFPEAGRIG